MFVMAPGMKDLLLVLISLCLAAATASADDQVRRLQEALRKRNLYFGQIDGGKNEEVTGAIKRYQQRQGLPPTGELTSPTLTSLGIPAAVRPGEEWPEGPVLKSDTARAVSEEERRRLEEVALAQVVPIAAPPPNEPPAGEPIPGLDLSAAAPAASPPRGAEVEAPAQFVREYLAACETNRLPEEMSFYAPRMSYFDHGLVDAAFVERDVQHFYKRWPHRRYELLDCKIVPVKEGEWDARFRIAFRYHNEKERAAAGRSLNVFRIQKGGDRLHFVSMKEQVVRE